MTKIENFKNWRPISLLSVLYKMLSSAIAERLKTVLDKLVSKCQTGFIKGRYIGESTRLIYNIMNYTEVKNKNGLLMLIDFEKAFDSIFWKFMYNILQLFGFSESFICWIKLMNTDFNVSILQAVVKSDFFPIERGCKQGDPIAPYLFLLCGQILHYMIEVNVEIKGIIIDSVEIKMAQFADNTTLVLDGSHSSLTLLLPSMMTSSQCQCVLQSTMSVDTGSTAIIWISSFPPVYCNKFYLVYQY